MLGLVESARPNLLFQDELAAVVGPAHAGEKRHAEQVDAKGLVGVHQRWNVAHDDVAQFDHLELHKGGAREAGGGRDLYAIGARGGMNAEPRSIAFTQRDLGSTGIDDELHPAAVDSRLHPEMPVVAAARVPG